MRIKYIILIVCLLISINTAIAANCGGATACNCGDTLTSSWEATQSLNDCAANGLTIGADNIQLDCNGFKIGGNGAATKFGIYMAARKNVTIKGCVIANFSYAAFFIDAGSSYNITIRNNTEYNNSLYGIYSGGTAGTGKHRYIDNRFKTVKDQKSTPAAIRINTADRNSVIAYNNFSYYKTGTVGIVLNTATNLKLTIHKNRFTGNGTYSVQAGAAVGNLTISNNYITNATTTSFGFGQHNMNNISIINNSIDCRWKTYAMIFYGKNSRFYWNNVTRCTYVMLNTAYTEYVNISYNKVSRVSIGFDITYPRYVKFYNNSIINTTSFGLRLGGRKANNSIIKGNLFQNITGLNGAAIFILGTYNNITENRFRGCSLYCVYSLGNYSRITNNDVTGLYNSKGIGLVNATVGLIKDNHINKTTRVIDIFGSKYINCTDNVGSCKGTATGGHGIISQVNSYYNRLYNNYVNDCSFGMLIETNAHYTNMSGNYLYNNTIAIYLLHNVTNNKVTNNQIIRYSNGIDLLDWVINNSISDNVLYNKQAVIGTTESSKSLSCSWFYDTTDPLYEGGTSGGTNPNRNNIFYNNYISHAQIAQYNANCTNTQFINNTLTNMSMHYRGQNKSNGIMLNITGLDTSKIILYDKSNITSWNYAIVDVKSVHGHIELPGSNVTVYDVNSNNTGSKNVDAAGYVTFLLKYAHYNTSGRTDYTDHSFFARYADFTTIGYRNMSTSGYLTVYIDVNAVYSAYAGIMQDYFPILVAGLMCVILVMAAFVIYTGSGVEIFFQNVWVIIVTLVFAAIALSMVIIVLAQMGV